MGTYIGNAGDLEKTLYGTVFSVFSVKHRENHIDLLANCSVIFKEQEPLTVDGGENCAAVIRVVLPGAAGQFGRVLSAEENPVALSGDAQGEGCTQFTFGPEARSKSLLPLLS